MRGLVGPLMGAGPQSSGRRLGQVVVQLRPRRAGACIALHAEVNALANCATHPRGGTIYITREPCSWCEKTMRAFGIAQIVAKPD